MPSQIGTDSSQIGTDSNQSATLASMTGFARHEGTSENISWAWELKSVNSKGLDLRFRMPSGFEYIEPAARKMFTQSFKRGGITVALNVSRHSESQNLVINELFLSQILPQIEYLAGTFDKKPSPEGVLNLKGILEIVDNDIEDAREEILASLSQAISRLIMTRQQEGAELAGFLTSNLEAFSGCLEHAQNDPSRTAGAIAEKLKAQIERLDYTQLDKDRLHQEAVLLAMKADIKEELDRLDAHLKSAYEILNTGGAVGRQMDFLMQEFNREANTICSKSNSSTLTAIGLEMKTLIDQMREQIQNIE